MKRRNQVGFAAMISFACTLGCVQNGARPSIWPTLGGAGAGVTSGVASTAKGVKGQLSSVGTAMSSAYNKTKTTLTSAFNTTPEKSDDPTSLNSKPSTLGPELFVAQGQLYETTGQYPKAIDNYSKALEIEPKNVSAMVSLARLHDRQNDPAKSIEFYKKAIELSPTDASMHVELGMIYKKQGQLAAAKESFQRAVNLQPKDAGHRTALAGALLEEGREQDALNEISQVDTPAMANYRMAHLYFTKQNVPQAQNYLASALRIDPNLQPARDLMNQLSGGGQIVQQAAGIYKNANNLYQNANGLIQATQQSVAAPGAGSMQPTLPPMTVSPTSAVGIPMNGGFPNPVTPSGYTPPSSPAISTPNAPMHSSSLPNYR